MIDVLLDSRSMPPLEAVESPSIQASLLGEKASKPAETPISLIETLHLAVFKPQMTLSIPIILYNGMRWCLTSAC